MANQLEMFKKKIYPKLFAYYEYQTAYLKDRKPTNAQVDLTDPTGRSY